MTDILNLSISELQKKIKTVDIGTAAEINNIINSIKNKNVEKILLSLKKTNDLIFNIVRNLFFLNQ